MQDQRSAKITLDKDFQKEERRRKLPERCWAPKTGKWKTKKWEIRKTTKRKWRNEETTFPQLSPPSSNLEVNVKKKRANIAFSPILTFIHSYPMFISWKRKNEIQFPFPF